MLAAITGLVKPCIAPLLADQSSIKHQRVITLESGERVIVDPSATLSKILGTYYWAVNGKSPARRSRAIWEVC